MSNKSVSEPQRYRFAWRNNERRAGLYGRECLVVAAGAMRTVLVEFLDDGERVTTSARALRKVPMSEPAAGC
ncbi:MAG TPA: hypothetical protein VH063_13990 [Gaiellaceae bacterium]|jgi:hypothetical protein|nr:hypothetical protein [Gaiellaceae bacterium]